MSEYIDNSEKRKGALRDLILDLHAGEDLEEIKARFRKLIGDVTAVEVAQLEQALIDEGLPAEEIKALCDVHVSVFQESLEGEGGLEVAPGHPIHTFRYENFALGEVLKLLAEAMAERLDAEGLDRVRALAKQLAEVEKIYQRKENLLFPFLEKHGVSGPSSVMWGLHDDVRDQMKAFRQALHEGQVGRAKGLFGPLSTALEQMVYKEEHILYPTALKVLSAAEWLAIRDQSDEIGYCLVRPGDEWQPAVEPSAVQETGTHRSLESEGLELDTGALTPDQINLLLAHLPMDVTFVDENDVVRYFSQGRKERIFTRTASIIGRKVQNCHPPSSVHVVTGLLDEFKRGARDVAEFWIPMGGKFVHIRYFALRDAEGKYRGTLEVSQDVAAIRALEGERRLLDEVG